MYLSHFYHFHKWKEMAGRAEMRKLIKNIKDEGATVIMVSHSMDDVSRMCSRIIVMNKGKVALDGTPSEVFKHAQLLESIHLGVPAVCKLRERLNEKGFNLPDDIYTIEEIKSAILEYLRRR